MVIFGHLNMLFVSSLEIKKLNLAQSTTTMIQCGILLGS